MTDRSFSAAEGRKGILGRGNITATVRKLRGQSSLEPLICCVTVGRLLWFQMLAPRLCRAHLRWLVQVKPHQTFSAACKALLPLSLPGKPAFTSQTPAVSHLPAAFLRVLPLHPPGLCFLLTIGLGCRPTSCLFCSGGSRGAGQGGHRGDSGLFVE